MTEHKKAAAGSCCGGSNRDDSRGSSCCGGRSSNSRQAVTSGHAIDSHGILDGSISDAHTANGAEESPGYLDEKRRYQARISRIEGQLRGIHRMIDEEQYCIDVLTQISAVNSALKSLGLMLLDAHLHHCVLHAAESGEEELEAKLAEASTAIARFAK